MKKIRIIVIILLFVVLILATILLYISNKEVVQFDSIPANINMSAQYKAEGLFKDVTDESSIKYNTEYLQELINDVSNAGGGTVHIPAGTYYFAPSEKYNEITGEYEKNELCGKADGIRRAYYVIECKNNVTVEGEGTDTILKPYGKGLDLSINMFHYVNEDYVYLENADFRNFVIDAEDTRKAESAPYWANGKGFMIAPYKDCDWDSVVVKNTDGTGFGMDCPIHSTITNCIAIGCGKAATEDDIGASGFGIGTGYSENESIYISNCIAIGNRKFGFFFEHQGRFGPKCAAKKAENLVVSNCTANGNMYNFGGERANDVTFENCISLDTEEADSNPLKNTNLAAFYFGTNSRRTHIVNCKVNQKFTDVDSSKEYYTPVYWALNHAIIDGGTRKSEFSPNEVCEKAQAIVLLWRMAERPGDVVLYGDTVEAGYNDVENNAWYTDAVKWGRESEILNSASTNFSPFNDCLRAEFITMLWRYAGKPVVETKNNFNDIASGAYYEEAVNWALSKGIIEDTNHKFLPNEAYTRGEIVTLLYRFSNPVNTVVYNYSENGGTEVEKENEGKREGESINLDVIAKKEGYEFVGWNTEKDATTGLTNLTMGTDNVTLYAIFKKDIKLTFVDYKGTEQVQTTRDLTIYNKNTEEITAPAINEYVGWTARYWTTGETPDAMQTVANEGTITNIVENVTYYGRYTKEITIEFNLNGGTGNTPKEVKENIEVNSKDINQIQEINLTIPEVEVTKEGYIFSGWNTKADGTGIEYEIGKTVTLGVDTILYAKWEADTNLPEDIVPPQLLVSYSATGPTNQNVLVTITANEKIQEVEGWELSEDKLTLTKTYTENREEEVTIKDLAGNTSTTKVKVSNIDKTPSIKIKKGDINQDGKIDTTDLLKMLRHIAASKSEETAKKYPTWILIGEALKAADINDDTKIDTTDTLKLLRHIASSKSEETANKHPEWVIQ